MSWVDRRSRNQGHWDDSRSAYGVDASRVVHSGSFRRLQGKTQILSINDGDFHRTRLTHSLEAAQIAEGIAERLADQVFPADLSEALPPLALVRAIALAHDLGHPPYGHSGEVALNYCMRDHGGFEGNGQTLRILSKLESFSSEFGADLTRRSLLGILKYPVSYSTVVGVRPAKLMESGSINIVDAQRSKPPKCYHDEERSTVEWMLADFSTSDRAQFESFTPIEGGHSMPIHKTLDCSVMELADDISYGIHDLEDGVALRLLSPQHVSSALTDVSYAPFAQWLQRLLKLPDLAPNRAAFADALFSTDRDRKKLIGLLVHYLVGNVIVNEYHQSQSPLLRYRADLAEDARRLLREFQRLVLTNIIDSPSIKQLEFKGQRMVSAVFDAFSACPALLPNPVRVKGDQASGFGAGIVDLGRATNPTVKLD